MFPPGSYGANCNGASTTLTGVALAPNGTDPVAQADVALFDHLPQPLASGVTCEVCNQTSGDTPLASTTAGANGAFTLSVDRAPQGGTLFVTIRKAGFRRIVTGVQPTACGAAALPAAQTSLPGTSAQGDLPKIVVSTGASDHLEKVLEAMGVTQFDCVQGSSFSSPSCASMTTLGQLLSNPSQLDQYALLFIACQPSDAFEPKSATDSAAVNLKAWAAAGGKLVVTDDSYDFVQQAFPDAIRFQGTPAAAGAPQPPNTGEVGMSSNSITGSVTDGSLVAWLSLFPGAVDSAGNVNLTGFLSNWAVQATAGAGTTSIVHGNAAWNGGSGDVPLTSEFEVNNCGRVIYSSYHTSGSGSGGPLLPQERILEYLMLQVGTCVVAQ